MNPAPGGREALAAAGGYDLTKGAEELLRDATQPAFWSVPEGVCEGSPGQQPQPVNQASERGIENYGQRGDVPDAPAPSADGGELTPAGATGMAEVVEVEVEQEAGLSLSLELVL